MHDRFWGTYQSIVYKKFFYEEHQRRSEQLLFWAKAVCAAVSILSVLIWSVSRSMPVLWSCLIALAQIAQTMLGFVPWSQQSNALLYLLPDLNELIVSLDKDWMTLHYTGNVDESQYIKKAAQYERSFFETENKFTNGIWFPVVKSVTDKAEDSTRDYFRVRYSIAEGVDHLAAAELSNRADT